MQIYAEPAEMKAGRVDRDTPLHALGKAQLGTKSGPLIERCGSHSRRSLTD